MYPTSTLYPQAIRSSHTEWVEVSAYRNGLVVPGGAGLVVDGQSGSSITDKTQSGVRWSLNLDLVPSTTTDELFDLLAPIGTQLKARSVLRYPSGATEVVPMGVFEIDSVKRGYGAHSGVTVQGSDQWVKVQRAQFLLPTASQVGMRISDQIAVLLRRALGQDAPVTITATSPATMGAVVWDKDLDKAIIDLADSIGAWVYFDRDGIATVANAPASTASPVWKVDAGSSGVMLTADRVRDRTNTYNAVVVNSDNASGDPLFEPVVVWDDNPRSPTFAGIDPVNGAVNTSAFGVVPYFYSSPLLQNQWQARTAAYTTLDRVKGLNAQLSLTASRNHALDAGDAIEVVLPSDRLDQSDDVERHIIDSVSHPLTPDGTQSIETRSTGVLS